MPTPPDASDRELMLAARGGELAALDALFVRHHRRLYGFLARLTGDRHAAEDLVQEVFLRVLRFRARYAGDGDFIAWLFRIARNVAADWYGRRHETPAPDLDGNASNDLSALDRLIAEERHESLQRAIAALPLTHREVLLLRGTERLSHRDLATALGCSEGAARVRLHRAIALLKREWHALAGELK